jgi:hypothetical protein
MRHFFFRVGAMNAASRGGPSACQCTPIQLLWRIWKALNALSKDRYIRILRHICSTCPSKSHNFVGGRHTSSPQPQNRNSSLSCYVTLSAQLRGVCAQLRGLSAQLVHPHVVERSLCRICDQPPHNYNDVTLMSSPGFSVYVATFSVGCEGAD